MKNQSVGKYQLIEKIGEGGMAEVYKAYDPQTDRYVAIKLIHTILGEKTGIQRKFRREGLLIAGLTHPAIVAAEEVGEIEDRLFIVMPLMEGGTLADRLASNSRFSLAEAVAFANRLAPALDHIHTLGIVHSDLKPGNILYGQDGLPYISDFGVARLQQPQPHTLSTLLFTPSYASPEQFEEGEPDGRSDLYSFGLIVYKALTGDLPYDATTPAQWMRAHLIAPIPDIRKSRPDLPKGIEKAFYRILAKSPAARYQKGVHFAQELERYVESQAVLAPLAVAGKSWLAFGVIGLVMIGFGILTLTNLGASLSGAEPLATPNQSQVVIHLTPSLIAEPIVAVLSSPSPTVTPSVQVSSTSDVVQQSLVINTPTPLSTSVPTSTRIVSATATQTPTATLTRTPSATATIIPTRTPTISPTRVSTIAPSATATVLPSPTVPSPTPTSTVIPPTATTAPAPEAARNIDPVFYELGGNIIPANVASGQQYYRAIEIVWHDEAESGGRHAIQFDVIDGSRNRLVGTFITISWDQSSASIKIEARPGEPFGGSFPMYSDGPVYSATVNGFPSDTVTGMGLGTPDQPVNQIHTEYFVVWQLATKP